MLLQEVPSTQGLLHYCQPRVFVLYHFYQVSDALLAMLAFDVDIKTADFLNAADSLNVEEDLIFKFLAIFSVDVEGLLGPLRVVEIFVDLEVVVILLEAFFFSV